MELVRKIKLNHLNDLLSFYHDGEHGEIIHWFMVDDGQGDVDWDCDVVSAEQADYLLEKYGILSQKSYD